ncbi:MAG: NAD-dependent epimerase/dehydratase family protein, partial [bacterium]
MNRKLSKWLITGSSGFLGRNFGQICRDHSEIETICVSRNRVDSNLRFNSDSLHGDFKRKPFWDELIAFHQPDVVVNLAGATPPAPHDILWEANFNWIPELLQAVIESTAPIKIVHAGSAAELGEVPLSMLPVSENYEAKPLTDYGRSKLAATQAILGANLKVKPVVARLFNLCGPGQGQAQAWGRYAAEIISRKAENPIKIKAFGLGNRRDFLDIRDAAKAIFQLAELAGSTGLYHVGCGKSISIGEGLKMLIEISQLR